MGPSNSMIDFLAFGNRKAKTADRVGEDMVQDFITMVRQYIEVPDLHTFIRDMMKVRKQIALMYFEKLLKKCIKGSLLYMLAKKKLPPKEQGNYVKLDKDKDGFVHMNEDGILQAEAKESIVNYEKLLEGERGRGRRKWGLFS